MSEEATSSEKINFKISKLLGKLEKQNDYVVASTQNGRLAFARDGAFDRVRTAEEIALLSRDYPALLCYDDDSQVTDILEEVQDVKLGYTREGWFAIRLPHLLPHKKYFEKDYIRNTVTRFAERYFSEHKPTKVPDCVIIFRYAYPADYPRRKVRDYDNIESKAVIDALANFLLPSDAPAFCRTFYCASFTADDLFTEVFFVPFEEFPQWLNQESSSPASGVVISPERPQKST